MIKFLKDIFFSFYLLISLLVLSIILTLNISPLLYYLLIKLNKIPMYGDLSSKDILKDYTNIIRYINSPSKENLQFDNFKISSNGEFHFLEVKKIFFFIYLIGFICLVLGLIFFIATKKFNIKISYKAFQALFYEILFLFFSLTLSSYLNFSKTFTIFHKIFFNNDFWIFDPRKDPIINVLPESYFLFLAIFILILVVLFSSTLKIFYNSKMKYLIN